MSYRWKVLWHVRTGSSGKGCNTSYALAAKVTLTAQEVRFRLKDLVLWQHKTTKFASRSTAI
ncbi:hypothetical protein CTM53_09225 [Prevotella intermedia]|uniref:Uncharacterized protein n=1 Tax=Prevotella intermedia TaxID=28131 RepID=A0A2D3M8U8_PREIN|nr:hypothetical protein CUB95_11750 [Prevotella intermedia]ATV39277.1 hypothetical protein CUB95_11830 [Prevotella intermedia]ATV41876.1 hypothetical protein CUC00_12505 [Prevotella intermedia]ATV56002.1 hypothetical protein CTM61_11805 [Prevotella intermedia]PJI18802.1 hypothetical protein CTM53_09225 [Prevotella intermedia]